MEEETVLWIVWSHDEKAYVTNLGQTFKRLAHVPVQYRHLILSHPCQSLNDFVTISHSHNST
jgi:ornithine carbamoyltransferase